MPKVTVSPDAPPDVLKLIAHDLRWALIKRLTVGDYQVHELVDQVGQPMNLVSYHLKKLRDAGIVTARRSEADARDQYYSLDLDGLRAQLDAVSAALHPALTARPLDTRPLSGRVLFVCTHNSARSQMAEAFLRHLSGGLIDAHSAGSHPTRLHPDAITTMQAYGIDISGQASKHVSEYDGQRFDYVITVCDNAREVCPTFPGGQQRHWGLTDPASITDPAARAEQFRITAERLRARIGHLLHSLTPNTA
jgi:protein-tyrosine-phosphatase/DNA-binding transcriptional ArsR family regulator